MRYLFGNSELVPDRRELYRDGRLVPVEPKVFDVLLYLIRHRDRVVSKRELLDQFWPQEDIYEGALNVCIHRCRRIVGEDGKGRVIQTFPGRGYRFIAPLEKVEERTASGVSGVSVPTLIGRRDQQKRLRSAMQAVSDGACRVVMIRGFAGVGKTTLLAAAGEDARHRGFDVLSNGSQDRGGEGPFSLWRELISACAAWHDRDELRRRLGADAALVARVAASLAGRLRLPKSLTGGANLPDRARLFAAAARLLEPSHEGPPLALLLDNLQDTDLGSLRLLEELARAGLRWPLLIVGAYRDSDYRPRAEAREIQAALLGPWVDESIRLVPLETAEIRELITRRAGQPVAEELQEAITRSAEGVPALAIEHWHQLVRSGVAVPGPAGWVRRGDPSAIQIPTTRGDLLAHRLAPVSPDTRRLLEAAAVIGREIDVEVLARVMQKSPEDVTRALAEAAEAPIVRPMRSRRGWWRFDHPVVRDFLYEQLPDGYRTRLHHRVGEVLEAMLDTGKGPALTSVAQHLLDGATAETAEHAIAMACQVGLQALSSRSFESATVYFEQALAVLDEFAPQRSLERQHLLALLAAAHAHTMNSVHDLREWHRASRSRSRNPHPAPLSKSSRSPGAAC